VIRCEGLTFDYPDETRALDGIDLSIDAGERVAITGRNGSGKTTLIRHWNGLLRPTAGRVLIDGRPTETRRVAELARLVGLAFQDPARQLFKGSVRAEVEFGARNVGLRGRELAAAADEALASVGLAEQARVSPYDLGPSRRRLLAIASVVAMRTPVLVLDEPTIGLDTAQRSLVAALVARLSAEGRTIVAISHDARLVASSFARVVRLDAGRIVADGPPDGDSPTPGAVISVRPHSGQIPVD
jgi:energy-coupling factor transport system ATP-binding protein